MIAKHVSRSLLAMTAGVLAVLVAGCGSSTPVAESPQPATASPTVPRPAPAPSIPQRPSAATPSATPSPNAHVQLSGPIDLLKQLDPANGSVQGDFRRDGTTLIVPKADPSPSYLVVPVDLPDEYVVVIEAEPLEGRGGLGLGLTAGDVRFMTEVDGDSGKVSGLQLLDGKFADQNETGWRAPLFRPDHVTRIVCTVHRQGVRAEADGTTIYDWRGDFRRLSLPKLWNKDARGAMFLGSWLAAYRVHKFELHPLGSQPLPTSSRRWLSDLPEQNAKAGWGKFGKNGNCGFENRPIQVAGKSWPKGLGLHPEGSVTYQLNGKYKTFHSTVALNQSAGDLDWRHPILYRVQGDGRLLWESRGFTARIQSETCDIDITGVQKLTLTTHFSPYLEPRDQTSAHAVWLDPYVDEAGPPAGCLPPAEAGKLYEERRDALRELVARKIDLEADPGTGKYTGVRIENDARFLNQDAELFAKLPALERIYFRGHPQVTDRLFRYLKGVRNLRSLEIVPGLPNGIIGSGLEHLAGSGLEELRLSGTLTDAGLVDLPKLTSLKVLELNVQYDPGESPRRPKVTDVTLQRICQMTSLEYLALSGLYTDEGTRQLGNLKNLRELHVAWTATDETLRIVGRLPKLQVLTLTSVHFVEDGRGYFFERYTDAGLQHLADLTTLETLSLSLFDITDAGVAHLGKLTSLKWLSIDCPQVTNRAMPHLAGLTNLEKLYLFTTGVGDPGLAVLHNFPKLRQLTVVKSDGSSDFGPPNAPIPMDEACKHIRDLPELEQLHLYATQLSGRGLANLQNLPKLKELLIHNTQVDDAGLMHLAQFKSLSAVRVVDTPVTKVGAQRLREVLPKCRIQGTGFFLH